MMLEEAVMKEFDEGAATHGEDRVLNELAVILCLPDDKTISYLRADGSESPHLVGEMRPAILEWAQQRGLTIPSLKEIRL